jgi:cytoskeletal protein CcmA (bactofilin family)
MSKEPTAYNGSEAMTVIGPEAFFHGSMTVRGSLRIEGEMEGNITEAVEVVVGKNGKVKGNISADRVEVAGKVAGDIICTEQLEILSSGNVVGNVRSPKLLVENGATLDGNCVMAESKNGQPVLQES